MKTRCLGAVLFLLAPLIASAEVRRVADMNTRQILALDRARTAVILVGGILEEHGPYLPSYTDGYLNERLAQALAERIAERPGWTSVLFPTLPLGQGAANIIGGHHTFPGSYDVRSATLRAVYMDLADDLGEQGFRWIFVVDGHGSPNSNRALNQASDYFRDVHGGRMVHLFGMMPLRTCCGQPANAAMSEAQKAEDGFTVHAGAGEHSDTLFVTPHLVDPGYKAAAPVTGRTFADLVKLASAKDWPGYFGSPRAASAAPGAQGYRVTVEALSATVFRILDGWDPKGEPRYEDVISRDPAVRAVNDGADTEDARREKRQRDWMNRMEIR